MDADQEIVDCGGITDVNCGGIASFPDFKRLEGRKEIVGSYSSGSQRSHSLESVALGEACRQPIEHSG